MLILKRFDLKKKHSFRGKLKRMIAQFGPYNWIQFEWKPLSSLGRWCATLGIMFIVRKFNCAATPINAIFIIF